MGEKVEEGIGSPRNMKFCECCGKSIPNIQKFCIDCGIEKRRRRQSQYDKNKSHPKSPDKIWIEKHQCQNCQEKAIALFQKYFYCKGHYQEKINER